MNISKLIERLEEIKHDHKDLPVYYAISKDSPVRPREIDNNCIHVEESDSHRKLPKRVVIMYYESSLNQT